MYWNKTTRKYQEFVEIDIREPIYDNYIGIYDRKIFEAIKKKIPLRIRIPQGVGIHDPKEWLKTGDRMEKVMLRPDEPMILWCNYVKVEEQKPPETDEEKMEKLAKTGVFG